MSRRAASLLLLKAALAAAVGLSMSGTAVASVRPDLGWGLRGSLIEAAAPPEPFADQTAAPDPNVYAERWRGALAGIEADRTALAACRAERLACTPALLRLEALVGVGRAHSGRARLGLVNRAVNLAVAYASDEAVYGVADLWSSPLATVEAGRGDCEDYALAKYLALIETGTDSADLRLVIGRPGPGDRLHAVLAVRHEGRWLVLDNGGMALVEDRSGRPFRDVSVYRARPAPAVEPVSPALMAEATAERPAG